MHRYSLLTCCSASLLLVPSLAAEGPAAWAALRAAPDGGRVVLALRADGAAQPPRPAPRPKKVHAGPPPRRRDQTHPIVEEEPQAEVEMEAPTPALVPAP